MVESDAKLGEIVRRLVTALRPERIYLFGSKARGDEGSESDYDVLVVVPDAAPPDRRRGRTAYRALRGTGTAAEVVVCTRARFEERRHIVSSLPATVEREGRFLYAS